PTLVISCVCATDPDLNEDWGLVAVHYDQLVANEMDPEEVLTAQEVELEKLKKALANNDGIMAELMFRQDSIEAMRERDMERRFAMVMKMVRNETQGERPDLEAKARELYLPNNNRGALALELVARDSNKKPNGINQVSQVKDAIATKPTKTADRVVPKPDSDNDDFSQIAKQRNIKNKKFQDLKGVK